MGSDEINAIFKDFFDSHNNRPDQKLGGLTPIQVHALIYSNWDNPAGTMCFNDNI